MSAILISLFVTGCAAIVMMSTQAYFSGEQTKSIHERNWRSESFEQLARAIAGQPTIHAVRIPVYSSDAYSRRNLHNS